MRILITGATGFVGQTLVRELVIDGHELVILSRRSQGVAERLGVPCQVYEWQPTAELPPPEALAQVDGVINMMGENLAGGRWTAERKQRIHDSRVLGTRNLVDGLARHGRKTLEFFISFSAIGYYPVNREQNLDETAAPGQGFLAEVCAAWEAAAAEVKRCNRLVTLRVGTVLGYGGGAAGKLVPLFKWGLGGPIGRGRQWMSWIHRDDLVRLVRQAVDNPDYQGVVNAVAEEPVTNRHFSKTLGRYLGRPAVFAAPPIALRVALGDMSQVVLDSQRIVSRRLSDLGFQYRYPTIDAALKEVCGIVAVGLGGETYQCERFEMSQFLAKPVDEVFQFFCSPYNLQKITPPTLSFEIKHVSSDEMGQGTEIDYRLKLHGIPMTWKTLIKEWVPNEYFVDFQLKGPYRIWHHRHLFYPVDGGTLMIDRVDYRLPMGFLGDAVGRPIVDTDVAKIFQYRRDHISDQIEADHRRLTATGTKG
jgi:hypothetical protein